jgi:hypothetical protein
VRRRVAPGDGSTIEYATEPAFALTSEQVVGKMVQKNRFLLALQQLVEYLLDQQVGTSFRPDTEFLRSRKSVLYGHGHFGASRTREAAVFESIDSR